MITLINDPAMRRKAARLFGSAIYRRWQVPSQEATAWVEEEFLHPESFVFAAVRDGHMHAVICGCPLLHVQVPAEEKRAVVCALGYPMDGEAPCPSSILHIGGLAVNQSWEHRKLVRPLHEAMVEEAQRRGFTHRVGQTVLPTPRRSVFVHHWRRVQPMGWRVLPGITSTRLVKDAPISWLVLP